MDRLVATLSPLIKAWQGLVRLLEAAQPLAQLAARIYIARAFFLSGLTKIRDWDITVALFTDEYKVPVLPPELAALMGTAGELVLPVLLVLGLGGRFAALGLFCVNAVAVISLREIAEPALQQHVFWGSLLVALALWGPGRWSMDHLLASWWQRRVPAAPAVPNEQAVRPS